MGGQKYHDEWQPVLGVLWDELDRNYWQEIAITAPVQASKSFGALVVPTLRDVISLGYSPIVGVPEADMFADKWEKDFRPVLESSPALKRELPEVGSGARGGRVRDMVTFGNGKSIKVMSRGGQSTNKAGFTSPRLRITEASGFSEASGSDLNEEADPYRQLVARLGAFDLNDPRRMVLIEGTGTIEDHLPWRLRGKDDDEILISSQSRLVSPCPHCDAWISPEREHLVGWAAAKSAIEAYENARFACPCCGKSIDDAQRRASVSDVRLVHHGQEITPDGTVIGPMPPTRRLWFRWSAWHNLLINIGSVAVAEWEAAQIDDGTVDRENAERDLCQKKWAVPYKPIEGENPALNSKVLMKRKAGWQKNLLPADTEIFAVGVDVGKWTSYWAALAVREDGSEHVPAYGRFDVMRQGEDAKFADRILQALAEFNDERILSGFPCENSDGLRVPDIVGIDVGDWPDEIAVALRTFVPGWYGRWFATRGRGISGARRNNGEYRHPVRIGGDVKRIGREWYGKWNKDRRIPEITFNAPYWLRDTQDRLRTKSQLVEGVQKYKVGSMTFYSADSQNEHLKFCSHLAAERLEFVVNKDTGQRRKQFVCHGDNHFGDALKIARVVADFERRRRGTRMGLAMAAGGAAVDSSSRHDRPYLAINREE